MQIYKVRFRVKGIGYLPIYMLSIHECFPERMRDAQKIADAHNFGKRISVRLARYVGGDKRSIYRALKNGTLVNNALWSDRGWAVSDVTVEKIEPIK